MLFFSLIVSVRPAALSVTCTFKSDLLFVNYSVLLNSFLPPPPTPLHFLYMCAQVLPSREYVLNDLTLLWVEVGQPCFKNDGVGGSDGERKRKIYR
jgi:hypothetical protein